MNPRGTQCPPNALLNGAALLACMVLLGPGSAGAAPEPVAVKTYVVTIEGLRFDPETLTVNAGDRIVWVNKDLFAHTVTASSKAFDSGGIDANASWTYTARIAGDYPYGCTYHPPMKGRLIVRPSRPPVPKS